MLEPGEGGAHVDGALGDVGLLLGGEHAVFGVDPHVPGAALGVGVGADLAGRLEVFARMLGGVEQPAYFEELGLRIGRAGAQVEFGQDIGLAMGLVDGPGEVLRIGLYVVNAAGRDRGFGFAPVVVAVHDRLIRPHARPVARGKGGPAPVGGRVVGEAARIDAHRGGQRRPPVGKAGALGAPGLRIGEVSPLGVRGLGWQQGLIRAGLGRSCPERASSQ